MILRPRQKKFVANCHKALAKHGNTLAIAATGFGKTVALSAVIGRECGGGGRAIVLAHRDELTAQNSETFGRVCPDFRISKFCADSKSWRGTVTFAMVQTLCRDEHLASMPAVDLLVIDEAHHVAANSYQKIIERATEINPKVKIFGVTATPDRADQKALSGTFNNIADVVSIGELVRSGHLVPPVGRVIDIGSQKALANVKKTASDFDMLEVEAIQNTKIKNRQIVDYWLEHSAERQTVAFSSTVKHADDVRDAFRDAGIDAESVHSEIGINDRRAIMAGYDRQDFPILINPMILTEGWDCQICSSVMLLRPSSHKSTVIQMAGRGLRKVDPKRYPGVIKKDCLLLDFGISLIKHGDLNADITLGTDTAEAEEGRKKDCPQCGAELPIQARACPLCGYEFRVEVGEDGVWNELEELRLIEIDLLNNSPFRWISLYPSGSVLIASGFEAWSAVCSPDAENWYSIGGVGKQVELLGISNKAGALGSADDWMRCRETSRNAKKAANWQIMPASQKQAQLLARHGVYGEYSKIEAAAHITFLFNRGQIERILNV